MSPSYKTCLLYISILGLSHCVSTTEPTIDTATHPDSTLEPTDTPTSVETLLFEQGISPDDYILGKLVVNSDMRYFWIVLPNDFDSEQEYPLWIDFHGAMSKSPSPYYPTLKRTEKLPSYRSTGFIHIIPSSYSEIKTAGSSRAIWVWHNPNRANTIYSDALRERQRDDFLFINRLITSFVSPSTQYESENNAPQSLRDFIKVNGENIFGTGHSSGGNFLYSFVLGGPEDITFDLMQEYKFKAISVSGANLRQDIVDFSERTAATTNLPSVLHIQGERDKSLWFNGHEDEKGNIDFRQCSVPITTEAMISAAGLRTTNEGPTYPAWNENDPTKPSTLKQWADVFGQQHSSYDEFDSHYYYNFENTVYENSGEDTDQKRIVGIRLKNCGHGISVDFSFRQDFFETFYNNNYPFAQFVEEYQQDLGAASESPLYGGCRVQTTCPAPTSR